MRHEEKVAYFEKILRERGYRIPDAIPPVWRLLWRLGFKTPPPCFLPFMIGVLIAGLPFGCFWGMIMWFIFWGNQGVSAALALGSVVMTGLLFGLFRAIFWFLQSKKLQLQDWDSFPYDV